jgi:hypothetical protein
LSFEIKGVPDSQTQEGSSIQSIDWRKQQIDVISTLPEPNPRLVGTMNIHHGPTRVRAEGIVWEIDSAAWW